MVTLYIYDLKADKDYNKVKRRFYYYLGKLYSIQFIAKSAVIVDEEEKELLEEIFKEFRDHILVYRVEALRIEVLE